MLAGYLTFIELRSDTEVNGFLFIPDSHFLGEDWPIIPAILAGVVAAALVGLLFQRVVLRRLRNAAPIVRVISTLAALAVVHSFVVIRYGSTTQPVDSFLP